VSETRLVPVAAGVRLLVRTYGGSAPQETEVVLVHGLASTSLLWDATARLLADGGLRVHAVDLRGHGDSDAPAAGYDTATAADDVAAVIAELSPAPVVIAGQSWGGNVAVQVAARYPLLVAGLVLVDGGWISLRGRFPSWPEALAALTPPDIDGMDDSAFRSMIGQALAGFPPGAVEAAGSVVRVRPDATVERRLTVPHHLQILRSMWDDEPARWYPAVAVPTLLMPATTGDETPAEVREAAQQLTQSRVRPYPGAHHDIHLQRPAEVAADIRSVL
jgi:pimeloyl-ACP methyl ester carboxylesterase